MSRWCLVPCAVPHQPANFNSKQYGRHPRPTRTSSGVFDRIFDASATGLVGSLCFSSVRRIEQDDWLGRDHGGVSASQSRFRGSETDT
ncbi:hypothetical protein PGTUg99_027583 [Puccinia graminis f. sp. tritici]|uniref:Uncharacterized protein n=1 Tax=Puccinia graminis f. sp. tritici TaxID=56615 RepID=A0A5B0SAZ7_PUCGR|nr:hypothetical protein PGTUg99_027583 [Puccinia graminis f. sp. tritici]